MKALLSICISGLLAACELQPAPKQQPPAPAAPAPAAPAPAVAAGSAAPAVAPPTTPCQAAGVRVADVLIAEARDAQPKATLEAERAQIVRRTEEACTAQSWPADVQDCIIQAQKVADIQACQKRLQPAVPAPAPAVKEPEKPAKPEKGALPPGTKVDDKTGKPVKADAAKPAKPDATKPAKPDAAKPAKGTAKKKN